MADRYNLIELMVEQAATSSEDGKTAVIGTGMPLVAAMLAQKTRCPNLITMFEAGISLTTEQITSVGCRLVHNDERPDVELHGRRPRPHVSVEWLISPFWVEHRLTNTEISILRC